MVFLLVLRKDDFILYDFLIDFIRNWGKTMSCPKCKAKIGVLRQQITTESGKVSGVLCYICGYWKQDHVKSGGTKNYCETRPVC
jgi:hypothetical protein